MPQPALEIGASSSLGGFSVIVRHDGPINAGVCKYQDGYHTRLLLDGWIREGAQVEVTFNSPDGSGLYAAVGNVRSAPPHTTKDDRYEIVVDLLQLPSPVTSDRLRPEPHRSSGLSHHYEVSGHMKAISGELSATAVNSEVDLWSANLGLPVGDRRAETPASLRPDRQSPGEFVTTVRFRHPESFVRAYKEQILAGGIIVQSSTTVPVGTTVRVRFTLPRQSIGYAAVGRVKRKNGVAEPGIWVKLSSLPAPTRKAFETAYATFAPEPEAPPSARRGWAFWRRKSHCATAG